MNLSAIKNNKIMKNILMLLVLAVFLALFCCYNLLKFYTSSQEVANYRTQVGMLQSTVSQMQLLAQDTEKTTLQIQHYETYLPSGAAQEGVFALIGNLAQNYRLELKQISCAETAEENGIKALPVSISVQGDYMKIMTMLESLTLDYRAASLKEIYISQNQQQVSVDAVLHFYFK